MVCPECERLAEGLDPAREPVVGPGTPAIWTGLQLADAQQVRDAINEQLLGGLPAPSDGRPEAR